MDSLLSQILNIHANQTEIVGVDVGVAWWMLWHVLWRKSDWMIEFALAEDRIFLCVWEEGGEESKGREKEGKK